MADGCFSGNKGEWSEPYVVLRLLADGRLCQADGNLSPSEGNFSRVLQVVRGDATATVGENGEVVFTWTGGHGQPPLFRTTQARLKEQADRLFGAIASKRGTEGSFGLPREADELRAMGFSRLTNPAPRRARVTKRDLSVKLGGPRTGAATLGFSVKSELGAPPTLLNASEPTNILFRVKGLTREQADRINAIGGSRKIMDRCRAIKNQAASVTYEDFQSRTFKENLDLVDSALPAMVAELVKVHYFEQILQTRAGGRGDRSRSRDTVRNAVGLLGGYASGKRENYCEIKIKRFLRACALGLMPAEEWNGADDASGGYIVVLPDGRLAALYVYNANLFDRYLYESTIFERASTSRHGYMTLIPDGGTGEHLLKLNLQIRFNR